MLLSVSFFLPPATATAVRSTMPVRTVAIGRPSRSRATTTRGTSTSFQASPSRATTTSTASSGSLFALSKGSPSNERSERVQICYSLILFDEVGEKLECVAWGDASKGRRGGCGPSRGILRPIEELRGLARGISALDEGNGSVRGGKRMAGASLHLYPIEDMFYA